jgi:hypothetical protein
MGFLCGRVWSNDEPIPRRAGMMTLSNTLQSHVSAFDGQRYSVYNVYNKGAIGSMLSMWDSWNVDLSDPLMTLVNYIKFKEMLDERLDSRRNMPRGTRDGFTLVRNEIVAAIGSLTTRNGS